MRPFDWIRRTWRKAFGDDATTRLLLNAGTGRHRTVSQQEAAKKYRSWVYVCASKNAQTVAAVPLKLYAKGTVSDADSATFATRAVSPGRKRYLERRQKAPLTAVVEITEHPLLTLLNEAGGPADVQFTAIESTVLGEELTGNAYWYLEPGTGVQAGQPSHIWPLLPQYTKVVGDKKQLKGYLYGSNPQDQHSYTADEVIHFKYPSPSDTVYGMGPMQAALAAVNRSDARAEYEQALWDNHARPDFLVRVEEGTTDDEITKLYEQWRKRFRGRSKAGMPWIATGDKGVEMLTFPPKDAQNLALGRFDRDEIFQCFGQHPSMAEAVKARAEAEAIEYSYMKHAIAPRTIRLEQMLNERLTPLYDTRLFLAFDDPVPENRKELREDMVAYGGLGVLTKNEIRQELGRDAVDGLDDFPTPRAPAPVGGEGVPPARALPFRGDSSKAVQPPLTDAESALMRKVEGLLRRQGAEVLERLDDIPEGSEIDADSVTFDVEKWAAIYAEELEDEIGAFLLSGWHHGERLLRDQMKGAGKALDPAVWDVFNAEVLTWAQTYPRAFGERVCASFAERITQVTAAGLAEGEGVRELRKRLQRDVLNTKMDHYRAETIARTESVRATEAGKAEQWKQSGVVSAEVWSISPDACPWCTALDGKVVALDEPYFPIGSSLEVEGAGTLRFGYEQVDRPPLHPRCRCTTIAVLTELPEG